MVKKPVYLPSMSFATVGEAKAYFRKIHNELYRPQEVVSDPEHDQVLRDVVAQHPAAEEKVGPGIREFFIALTSDGNRPFVKAGQTGIWIRDVEGDERDFSYNTALDRPDEGAVVRDALRNAIARERVKFREDAFTAGKNVTCPDTGVLLTAWDQAAVVYRNPKWADLTARFAHAAGGWSAIETHRGHGGVQVGNMLSSGAVKNAWIEFWKANAHPVLIAKVR